MKRFAALLLLGTVLCTCCSNKDENEPKTPEEEKEFFNDSYNAHFVEAISGAYDYFLINDEMPKSVNVDGINYNKGQYVSAAKLIIEKFADNPQHWEDIDVELPKASFGSSTKWNTLDQDSLSIAAVRWLGEKVFKYIEDHGAYPNYYSFTDNFTDSDGGIYIGNINFVNYAVIFARIVNFFYKNHRLPVKVSSWGNDFLRKTKNCDIDSPIVISAMNEAIKDCKTDRAKAEKIFEYARDEWEWQNYSNTRKGSVETIKDKAGNCCDLTHATLAMCRAAGIPARYMHGQCYFKSGVVGHVIPEIYVDGKWWICDPSNNSCTFGKPNWNGMQTFNGRYNELPF